MITDRGGTRWSSSTSCGASACGSVGVLGLQFEKPWIATGRTNRAVAIAPSTWRSSGGSGRKTRPSTSAAAHGARGGGGGGEAGPDPAPRRAAAGGDPRPRRRPAVTQPVGEVARPEPLQREPGRERQRHEDDPPHQDREASRERERERDE